MCLFIVYPFYTILTKSVFSSKVEGLTLYNFVRFFTKPYYYQTLLRSLFVCGVTVLTTTIIGVPIAYVMTRYNVPGKQLLHILIIMSLMSPPFIGAYSWIVLMGRNGLIAKLFRTFGATAPTIYGRGGIIFVFTLHLFPYIYLYTSGAMNSIDSSLEEAAENLGMNKLKRIWTVTLPVILPSILAGCVMVHPCCWAKAIQFCPFWCITNTCPKVPLTPIWHRRCPSSLFVARWQCWPSRNWSSISAITR